MNIRYVAQEFDWSESMKKNVESEVAAPLAGDLKTGNFELSMLLKMQPQNNSLELWAVLQTFDGHCNEIIRRKGEEFSSLLSDVSQSMRSTVRKARQRPSFWQALAFN